MARLRQQHPQNYVNSGNIHTDFENVIRYLNTAELGDKTLSELMATLFNEEGVFDGPVQMRSIPSWSIQRSRNWLDYNRRRGAVSRYGWSFSR